MEQWKDIVIEKGGITYNFTGKYQVSTLGRIRSLNYNKTGEVKILKQTKNKNGYWYINLTDGKTKSFYVHRLVATAFIPNPNNYSEVNHKDVNPSNNSVDNLEWMPHKENTEYSQNKAVRCINTGQVFESAKHAATELGISRSGICYCCQGKLKTSGGFMWEYVE